MPGDPPPEPPALATPAARLGGAVVDGAVLQLAGLVTVGAGTATAAALSGFTYLAYEVVMVATRGQTLGKLGLGTRVMDGVSGGRPTLWQAATRAVVPLAGVVVDAALGSVGVGALWVLVVYGSVLFDAHRRGLHDRAAGTVVVSVERSAAHRRVGVVVVVAALAFTLVTLAVAVQGAANSPAAGAQEECAGSCPRA